ncbi:MULTISPECIES: aldehyde dehydrogenase family protein [Arthrobacter]|uniref:Aldehyde dehydrogenase family protein n=1 Tax=Arthrobacter terricola TaxID=2547396 RepID=A0A4R5K9S0_9MICC|nr:MULTISPECIES: aldehyde dehydrogenase family protein [Arthrobacter]MBT8163262.1 aldehyde dehydrogenase family protein [Arthrobacter sp. GN70]TDF91178.1 aldehyde dehydrogenase family protein [Arthrobacter terricola]
MTLQTDPALTTIDLSTRTFKQLIDGQLLEGASSQSVIDPATGEAFAVAPVADEQQANEACLAAARAYIGWQKTAYSDRTHILEQIAVRIEERRQEIAEIITLENGKPIAEAEGDVDAAVTWLRYFNSLRLDPEVLREDEESRIEVHRKPLGVVLGIIPWNFPFFQTIYKLAPALLAGNTIVLKPAPTTPLNAMIVAEIVHDLVPAGVVNVVGDGGEIGPYLSAHPSIAKVSFTGSTTVGKKVLASGDTVKRVVLELGGNDAAVVLADADIPAVAKGIFEKAFWNTGQVCINIKRIYVHASQYEEFCSELARHAAKAKIGPGMNRDNEFGPLQNARQLQAAKAALDTAARDGKIIAGGNVIDGPGYFVELTVVRDIDESSPLVSEETFAPIRSVLKYEDIDEVIERANRTDYGLGNSVWGSDVERATTVARQLESGTVWVNTHSAVAPDVPFGGRKQSGLGVEFGIEGLLEFTDSSIIHIAKRANPGT